MLCPTNPEVPHPRIPRFDWLVAALGLGTACLGVWLLR